MSAADARRPPLVALVGPTAVGKTAACAAICGRLVAEVISADSVQVYRGLDIGSAKPGPAELAAAPHHLLDVADPGEHFDAARFVELADRAAADITGRGKRVLVSGGTGLYLKALLFGLAPAPPRDQALRARLSDEWQRSGPAAMHARLAGLDPAAAAGLHPNDRQRVLRALEVALAPGPSLSRRQADHGFAEPRYPHLLLGLTRPRAELNARIEARCRAMWRGGLLEEVRGLLAAGVDPGARALGSLGYRQALAVLAGELSGEEGLEQMIARTRAYAKRQMTWFRGAGVIHWHTPEDVDGLCRRASEFWAGAEGGSSL